MAIGFARSRPRTPSIATARRNTSAMAQVAMAKSPPWRRNAIRGAGAEASAARNSRTKHEGPQSDRGPRSRPAPTRPCRRARHGLLSHRDPATIAREEFHIWSEGRTGAPPPPPTRMVLRRPPTTAAWRGRAASATSPPEASTASADGSDASDKGQESSRAESTMPGEDALGPHEENGQAGQSWQTRMPQPQMQSRSSTTSPPR